MKGNNYQQVKDSHEIHYYRLSMDNQLTHDAPQVSTWIKKYFQFYKKNTFEGVSDKRQARSDLAD